MDCFHQTLVGFCPTNNNKLDYFYQTLAQVRSGALSANQDGLKNGPNQSVCTCGHSNLIIYRPIPSKVHIWTTFIKLLFMSEYVFCPMNDNEECRQNGYPFSLQDITRDPLSEPGCSS